MVVSFDAKAKDLKTNMSKRSQVLRALVTERLTAAADEIFALVERTIAEYEEELCRSREENQRRQFMVEAPPQQRVLLHGFQINLVTQEHPEPSRNQEIPETPQIKAEPVEQSVKHEEEQLPQFTDTSSKTTIIISKVSSLCDVNHSAEPFSCSQTKKEFTQRGHLDTSPTATQMETEADGDNCNQIQIQDTALFTKSSPETEGTEGGGNHECPFCTKTFVTEQKLEMHVSVHSGDRPFSSTVCKSTFSQKGDLDMRTHTGEQPYSCCVATSGGSSSETGSTVMFNVQYREKTTHMNLTGLSYSSFLCEAKQRFGIHGDVYLMDGTGTKVDDDVFTELIKQQPGLTLIVVDAPSISELTAEFSCADMASRPSHLHTVSKRPRTDDSTLEPDQSLNATTSAETEMSQNCSSVFKEMSHNTCEDSVKADYEDSIADHKDKDDVPDSDDSSSGGSMNSLTGFRNNSCHDGTVQNSSNSCSYHSTVTSSTDMPTAVAPMPAMGSKHIKKQYCIFCKKPFSKLARHLQSVHKNEQDVALAISFDKGSKKRREMLRFLKKRGNFSHNTTVITSGVGELVACKRPGVSQPPDDYVHCKFCQGLYSRKCLWRHVKRIHKESVQGLSKVMRKGLYMHLPKPASVKDAVWKMACAMNNDDISATVRSESTILQLGELLYNSRKPQEKQHNICQKMRQLARLLIEARATTPLKSMEDLVTPTNFPHVIKAVKSTTGYKEESNSNAVPALTLKLGHSLIKVAGIIHCNALIEDRKDVAESAKNFAILYKKKLSESTSSAALGTLKQTKWNKPLVLPFVKDVTSLHKYLSVECAKYMKSLEEEPNNKKSFSNLAKVTLTQVFLFNRGREGEVSKIELSSYTSRHITDLNPDILASLSEFERKLAEHFERVEMRGKRSRKVPILLTPDMTAAMDLLTKKREECQVPKENIYVFAQPEALSYYRGSDCLDEYAMLCGAQHPEALTSTKLRKQMATLFTVLNLKDNEMDQLATYLGHDISLPESTLQLAKVSKLLMAMENGIQPELQGKRLDNVIINSEDSHDTAVFPEGPAQTTRGHRTEATPKHSVPKRAVKKQRQMWTQDEVKVVEQHMLGFIARGQLPGKKSCASCLQAEPRALKRRDWLDIKNYVHNRIAALKRKEKKKK